MDLQDALRSRIVTAILVMVFAAVSFVTVELYMQKKQVDSEIKRLQTQSEQLNQDNRQLSELIKYLDTPEYKEKEAREKLNLKKPGEEVVVLPEDSSLEGSVAGADVADQSNPRKWFAYFFEPQ
jgi:cell division protein FtsB